MFLLTAFALVAAFAFCVYLEPEDDPASTLQQQTRSYRHRSLVILRQALYLLWASARLGWARLLSERLPHTAWGSLDGCDLSQEADPEVLKLRNELTAVQAIAEDYHQQCLFLDSRLAQAQLQADRHASVAKKLRRQSDISSQPTTSQPNSRTLKDAVYIVNLFWRLSRTLCEKVTRLTLSVAHLESSLSAARDACTTLRLKNGSLSSALTHAQGQLELSSREQQAATSELCIWKTRYARSIDARHHAASSWFTYRLQADALRTASFGSLLKMLGLLWRMTVGLRSALRDEKAALATALNAQQGLVRDIKVLRTELNDEKTSNTAIIDQLRDERDDFKRACQQARGTHAELEAAYDRLMESHTTLEGDFHTSSSELVETSQERDSLRLESQRLHSQLGNTQRELACTTSLLTRLQEDHSKLSRSNDDLSARSLFLQAQGNALATQHSALGQDLDTLKLEHKTLRGAHDSLNQRYDEEQFARTSLANSLSAAEQRLEEYQTAQRLRDSSLQPLRAERHRLSHADHDAWIRALNNAQQDDLSPSLASSEIVVSAQEDTHLVLALLGYAKGLRRRIGELEHRRDTLWLPAFNLMQNIGGQINSVALDNLPPTPSPSMTLPKLTITLPNPVQAPLTPGTPTLSHSTLPTPVSTVFPSTPNATASPLPPTHVQVGLRDICASSASSGWSSTCSDPQLNDVFSTSVRVSKSVPVEYFPETPPPFIDPTPVDPTPVSVEQPAA